MPRKKKDPSVRARRNTAATKATLLRTADQDSTTAESYAAMTLPQLRAAIDVVNQSRPADQQLPKRGTKAALVELLVAAERNIPALPPHPPAYIEGFPVPVEWHTQTEAWWNDVWTSPMAREWDESDVHNVLVVALLYDDIWSATSAKERKDALAEYRLQRADLGLSPYSRRRLEWTIETAAEAKERGQKRRAKDPAASAAASAAAAAGKPDPRLHLVQ